MADKVTPTTPGLKPGTYRLNDGGTLTVRADGQRVVVQKNGRRLVFDRFGNVVDSGRRQLNPKTGKTSTEDRLDAPARKKAADDAKAAQQATTAREVEALNQNVAWIDGKRVRFVGFDENGSPTYTLNNAGNPNENGAPYVLSKPTAYGALEAGELADQNTRFVMANGTQMYGDGSTGARHQTSNPNWDNTNTWNRVEQQYTRATGTNYMTIGNGLTWLANLSMRDKDAYAAMLDKLHRAGYLTDAQFAAAGGAYSALAGMAFAKAATDLSVLNGQGATTSLQEFLDQRASANDANAEASTAAAYTPVARTYTDPEDLKKAAKSTAEQVLGRQLNDDEEAQLVGHFRSLEDAAYNQMDAAQGKSYHVTPPGMGQVDAFVDGPGHAQEAANYRAAEYGLALKHLFGLT